MKAIIYLNHLCALCVTHIYVNFLHYFTILQAKSLYYAWSWKVVQWYSHNFRELQKEGALIYENLYT